MSGKHKRRSPLPRSSAISTPGRLVASPSVAEQVRQGLLDDLLPELIDAINARTAELARLRTERALERLSVGSRVVISGEAKPQYLRGQSGEVHEIDGDVVVVCLDTPVGRFTSGHVRCPPGLLVPLGT